MVKLKKAVLYELGIYLSNDTINIKPILVPMYKVVVKVDGIALFVTTI